jgi:xylose isomerase
MLEDGGLEEALKERYAGWETPKAQQMLNSDLASIAKSVTDNKISPRPVSGQQEILENYVNRFV